MAKCFAFTLDEVGIPVSFRYRPYIEKLLRFVGLPDNEIKDIVHWCFNISFVGDTIAVGIITIERIF